MNPLNAHVYQIGERIYRRNIPLEECKMGNLVSEARLYANVEEDEVDCTVNIGESYDYGTHKETESGAAISSTKEKSPKVATNSSKGHLLIEFNKKKKSWSTEIYVPQQLMGRVIGVHGNNAKMLEQTTNCRLKFPERGIDKPIMISSIVSRESVERCYDSIAPIVAEGKKKRRFTHFIMFPLCLDNSFQERYKKFQAKIRELADLPDDLESILMSPEKIHFTIVPLWLFSSEDEKKARDCLKTIMQEKIKPILNEEILKIQVKGLRHFGDEDPAAARVVWAKSDCKKLQEISQIIADEMQKNELGSTKKETVKLHMTIINTNKSKERRKQHRKRKIIVSQDGEEIMQEVGQLTQEFIRKSRFIDATAILDKFKDYDLGEIEINQVRICQIGGTDPYTKGYPTIYMHKFNE